MARPLFYPPFNWLSFLGFARRGAKTLAVSGLLLPHLLAAQTEKEPPKLEPVNEAYVSEHYTKHEYRVPMRDGVTLFTAVYQPKDDSKSHPIILSRTPYGVGPYGEDRRPGVSGPLKRMGRETFIFVFQDVRGRNGSEGVYVHMRPQKAVKNGRADIDESTDAYDTIDWLVKNLPNNNGKVGMTGISYPGFYTAAGMIDSHPTLVCASPQAPIADWFIGDDFHHNGAFYLPHAFNFFSGFGQKLEEPTRESSKPFDYKTRDGYDFYLRMGPLANSDRLYFKGKIEFWDEFMNHGTYDSFWQARNLLPHLKNVKTAVMTVGGWYDAEDLYGPLHIFQEVERNNPGLFNSLVIGPWFHGGWSGGDGDHMGNVEFHQKTSEFFRQNIELPFFKHFLKGDTNFNMPKAWVFETGSCQWRRYDSWPPKNTSEKRLYFHANGKLSFEPPANEGGAFDEYVSDPAKPVPFIPNIAIGMTREHMTDDQRFAGSRPDVLVYQTDVLEEDLTIAGPITARLQVSTTGTDSDWVVKLIDVYSGDYPNPKGISGPITARLQISTKESGSDGTVKLIDIDSGDLPGADRNPTGVEMSGYQQLVRGEAMRGKFRNSYEKPEPFEPGKMTRVEYVLPDAYHTFRRGHRIMVQLQSSWFPLVDRNPQKFCDIYHASAEDFQKATQRVYHTGQAPSHVGVLVLEPKK